MLTFVKIYTKVLKFLNVIAVIVVVRIYFWRCLMTDFKMNCSFSDISSYIKRKDQNISEQDLQGLSSIFNQCDEIDNRTKLEGKDGILNNAEWRKFITLAGEKFTGLLTDFKAETELKALNRAQIESAAPQDNTRVAPKIILEPIKLEEYNYKNDPNYNKVLAFITKGAKEHDNKKVDAKRADEIVKEVLTICKKYNISDLSTIVAQILNIESGGFVFDDDVMVNSGSQFKGVMQVNFETICCIYGEAYAGKVSKGKDKSGKDQFISSKRSSDVYKYDNEHYYSQDASRISQLKKNYPTQKDLYQAIQKDPSLGIEVGIIAFKAKIGYAKGDVKKGVEGYCKGQYTCDLTGAPLKVSIKNRK